MNFQEYLSQPAKLKAAKILKVVIWVLSAVVFGLVGLMRRPEYKFTDFPVDFSFLPPVHAALNSLVAVLLVLAIVAIKKKNIGLHKLAINAAMVTSILFLLCYVAYHFTVEETKFGGEGTERLVYFFLLITHIVLAGISLPFILFTWMFGMTNQFNKHKNMAKWVFPMWLYVAVTGPICYFLLKPYY